MNLKNEKRKTCYAKRKTVAHDHFAFFIACFSFSIPTLRSISGLPSTGGFVVIEESRHRRQRLPQSSQRSHIPIARRRLFQAEQLRHFVVVQLLEMPQRQDL